MINLVRYDLSTARPNKHCNFQVHSHQGSSPVHRMDHPEVGPDIDRVDLDDLGGNLVSAHLPRSAPAVAHLVRNWSDAHFNEFIEK